MAAFVAAVLVAAPLTVLETATAQPAAAEASASEPTEKAAFAVARASGDQVEIESRRGESSETFANQDGSYTTVEHLKPVRTRKAGRWADIDTALASRSDGSVAPGAVSLDGLSFSGGGTGPLARMSRAGRELALSWPLGALPKPSLDGAAATYAEVLPGVDLRVTAEADGFSHVLVVKTREAAQNPALAKLRFGLSASHMKVTVGADGRATAVDAGGGGEVFEAPAPLMWDSPPEESEAASTFAAGAEADGDAPVSGPGDAEHVAEMDMTVGGGALELMPDQQMLSDPDTRFPVFLDPSWSTPKASAWGYVSRAFPSQEYWKFSGKPDSGMGYCAGDSRCAPNDVKRIFYKLPTSTFAGKTILSAEFIAKETFSYSCDGRGVQLWLTKAFGDASTWNSTDDNWLDHLTTRDVAKGWSSSCPGGDVEFNAIDAVKKAAAGKWSTTTFGLRASNEDDPYGWKRFADDAYLRVNYNSPPKQPLQKNLTMQPGGACSSTSTAVNEPPLMRAYLFDADKDGENAVEELKAEFKVNWPGGSWTGMSGWKTSGQRFEARVPSTMPVNVAANWSVRAYDGTAYGPWSWAGNQTACYFHIDTQKPEPPKVDSTDYPASDPDNTEDPWLDGVGRYGAFTIDSESVDVTRYEYQLNDGSWGKAYPATAGGPVTVQVAPSRAGPNYLRVKAIDPAGNESDSEVDSAIGEYVFRVKAGAPAKASWALDEHDGAGELSDGSGALPAPVTGGVTLGVAGMLKTAMQVNGIDGYAKTSGPAVDTSKSFAVSAWARLPADRPTHSAVVVSQAGPNNTGFELYYSSGYDRWIFNRYDSQTAPAAIVRAIAPTAPTDDWAHLVGVYDAVKKTITLYVNGHHAQTTAYTKPWNATGGVHIGSGRYGGAPGNFFSGEIDDVRIFDRLVSDEEAEDLAAQVPVLAARWKLNDVANSTTVRAAKAYYKLDELAGASRAEDATGTFPAGKSGGVTFGEVGKYGKAMRLDGTSGYLATATTAGPMLDTSKSFSVSAWAKLPATKPTHAGIIATQKGTNRSGFELYYSSKYDRWIFNRYDSDTTDAAIVRAQSTTVPKPNTWTHLTGVYDAEAEQIRLYVNGVLAQTTAYTKPWNATGEVQLGVGWYGSRASFFTGHIDDVRIFDQKLNASEAAVLATGSPDAVTADESSKGLHATLAGEAKIDQSSGWIGDPAGGLMLDGATGYAATAGPALHTNDSFTIAGWVSALAPTGNAAVFSQEGAVNSAFTLRLSPQAGDGLGGYQIEMPDEDATEATRPTVDNPWFQVNGKWDHVAIVYDAFDAQMRLYVNGELEQTTDSVSWRSKTVGFDATKPFQIGRSKSDGVWGEYWPGVIDDVWAFTGVLNDDQIGKLAVGGELPTIPGPLG